MRLQPEILRNWLLIFWSGRPRQTGQLFESRATPRTSQHGFWHWPHLRLTGPERRATTRFPDTSIRCPDLGVRRRPNARRLCEMGQTDFRCGCQAQCYVDPRSILFECPPNTYF